MLAFAAARLIQSIPLIISSTIVVFLLIRLIPGDPALVYAGTDAPPEVVEQIRKDFGLDKPLPLQYAVWLSHVLRGDLGRSYLSGLPVSELLSQRIPATLELTLAGLALTVFVGVPAGILAALRSGRPIDWAITSSAAVSLAIPNFWLGILMIYLFALVLNWLPPGGRGDFGGDPFLALQYLILPTFALASGSAAMLSRLVKSAMLEALYEDYVRTARAKGLTQSRIVVQHVLRNALVPVVTLLSFQLGKLLGGAVITESVFAWPGVGRLLLTSISTRDYAVVQGVLLLLVFVFILINLITDIFYGVIDPRIRVGGRAG